MTIEGKVAAILNERELVINKGSVDSVVEDMAFEVLESISDVQDPDTGENIGSLERPKIKIKIVETQPKMSVGRTYETYQINVGGKMKFTGWPLALIPEKWVTKVKTLRTDEATFGELEEAGSIVRVGDKVRQIVQPPIPHAFHGKVRLHDSPAPIGTRVEARSEGVRNDIKGNPVVTTKAGQYGGADPMEEKLIVQGNIAEGAMLTFYVNGLFAGQSEWHSGEVTKLDLFVT